MTPSGQEFNSRYNKKILLLIFWGMFWGYGGSAQKPVSAGVFADTLKLNGEVPDGLVSVTHSFRYYFDTTGRETAGDLFKKPEAFITFKQYLKTSRKTADELWLRINIKNVHPKDTLNAVILFGAFGIAEVHKKNSRGDTHHKVDWSSWGYLASLKEKFEIPVKIPPAEFETYLIKTEDQENGTSFDPNLYSPASFKERNSTRTATSGLQFTFMCMIMGLCLFMGMMAILQRWYGKDATYGYWALYLLANSLFFFTELDRAFTLKIIKFVKSNSGALPWTIPVQYLIEITYILFLNSFLEIKKKSPSIYRFVKITVAFMSTCFLFAFFAVANYNLHLTEYADMLILFTNVFILILVFRILKSDIPQKNLLLIGTFIGLLSATIAAVIEAIEINTIHSFWLIPIVCYGFGVVGELAFFSLALSQRTRQIQLENQQLQQNYTLELEKELAERVALIQTQNKQLEEQRIITLTSEFEQRIAETEITALRSQMNPHFIFNCLNSIKLYSLENDSEAASEYLTKFSRLIRLVLENSRSEKVTLENELETLKLYVEMEEMRFKGKIKYEFNIDRRIDSHFIEIPPLLLQPFIENAIWHGLMHKEEGGTVKVNITQNVEKYLHIEIIDDGIGREKSAEYKSKSATRNKSFGMKVTSERIELINQLYKTNTRIEIIDLKDKNGMAKGTKVILNIPI